MSQCDKKCGNCRYHVVDIYVDSFGEYIDEYCRKTNRGVEPYHEGCELWDGEESESGAK